MLYLPTSVYRAIRAHAEQAYPRESCGALLGTPAAKGWQIASALPLENASTSSTRYEIASPDLVRIARTAREQGLEIAGFYHSHPDAPPVCSATDLAEAHWLEASYVITAVMQGKAAETCSYRLAGAREEDKHFIPEPIELAADR